MGDDKKNKKIFLTYFLFFISTCFSFAFPLFSVILIKISNITPNISFILQSFVYLCSGFLQIKVGRKIDDGNYAYVAKIFFIFAATGLLFVFIPYLSNLFLILSLINFIVCVSICLTTFNRIVIASVKGDKERTYTATISQIIENAGLGLSSVFAYFFLAKNFKKLIVFDIISTAILFFGIIIIHNLIPFKNFKFKSDKIIKEKNSFFDTKETKSNRKKIKYRNLVLIGVAYILIMSTVFSIFAAIPALFLKLSIPIEKAVPIAFLSSSIAIIIFSLFLMKYISKNSRYLFPIGIFTTAFGHALLPICENMKSIFLCIFVISIGESIILPTIISKYYKLIHKYQYPEGDATGTLVFMRRIGMVLSPLIALPLSYLNSSSYFSIIFFLLPIVGFLLVELNDSNLKKKDLNDEHV